MRRAPGRALPPASSRAGKVPGSAPRSDDAGGPRFNAVAANLIPPPEPWHFGDSLALRAILATAAAVLLTVGMAPAASAVDTPCVDTSGTDTDTWRECAAVLFAHYDSYVRRHADEILP